MRSLPHESVLPRSCSRGSSGLLCKCVLGPREAASRMGSSGLLLCKCVFRKAAGGGGGEISPTTPAACVVLENKLTHPKNALPSASVLLLLVDALPLGAFSRRAPRKGSFLGELSTFGGRKKRDATRDAYSSGKRRGPCTGRPPALCGSSAQLYHIVVIIHWSCWQLGLH